MTLWVPCNGWEWECDVSEGEFSKEVTKNDVDNIGMDATNIHQLLPDLDIQNRIWPRIYVTNIHPTIASE